MIARPQIDPARRIRYWNLYRLSTRRDDYFVEARDEDHACERFFGVSRMNARRDFGLTEIRIEELVIGRD